MTKVTRNEVDYYELYMFAEKHYKVECCSTLFMGHGEQRGVLDYKRFNDFKLCELKDVTIENSIWCETPKTILAKQIIYAFMKAHNVDSIRVFNDC